MFTRRQILIATAASAAAGALSSKLSAQDAQKQQGMSPESMAHLDAANSVDHWKKTVCRYCGIGCGVMVGVKDGMAVAVKGDPQNSVNEGMLCVKGYHLADMLYAESRLKTPLIRKNGQLVESSWEEALDLIGNRFSEIRDTHGPDALGFYGSGQCSMDESYLYNKLFKGFIGTNNVEGNPRTCMASAVAGYVSTFGKDEPLGTYDDLNKADVFFFIGANPAEAHPIIWARVLERRKNAPNTKIIVCDPRETRSTDAADIKVIFKPNMDLALLNSMAYVMVKNGMHDRAFIDQHINFQEGSEGKSWEDYMSFLEDYAPEKVADEIGVPAALIEQVAKLFGDKNRETMSMWTMGLNQRSRGQWVNNLINGLHLITGKLCRPGSTPFSLTGQPSACGSVREVGALCHLLPAHRFVANEQHRKEIADIWGIPADRIQPKPGKPLMKMFQATVDEEIKGLWVMCTNPGQSLPNVNKYRKGMEKCFMVVSETFHPTRTTELADVVLPAALWCEKEGIYGNAERRTQHMAKAIDPPGGVKSDHWAILEVAKRMGYGDSFNYKSVEQVYEEYRRCTVGTGYDVAPFSRLKAERGVRWPVVGDGMGKEASIRYAAPYDPYVEQGIRFYGKPDGKAIVFLRPQADAAEKPSDEFPFVLTNGRLLEQWHTMTMTGTVPALKKIPEYYQSGQRWFVEMHEQDAQRLGITNGDNVRLTSAHGKLETRVVLNGRGRPQPGLLYMNFHDQNPAEMVNILVSDATDPVSHQPEYKISACKIEKV